MRSLLALPRVPSQRLLGAPQSLPVCFSPDFLPSHLCLPSIWDCSFAELTVSSRWVLLAPWCCQSCRPHLLHCLGAEAPDSPPIVGPNVTCNSRCILGPAQPMQSAQTKPNRTPAIRSEFLHWERCCGTIWAVCVFWGGCGGWFLTVGLCIPRDVRQKYRRVAQKVNDASLSCSRCLLLLPRCCCFISLFWGSFTDFPSG